MNINRRKIILNENILLIVTIRSQFYMGQDDILACARFKRLYISIPELLGPISIPVEPDPVRVFTLHPQGFLMAF